MYVDLLEIYGSIVGKNTDGRVQIKVGGPKSMPPNQSKKFHGGVVYCTSDFSYRAQNQGILRLGDM
jgi:predicted outer membrane repeat protein